MSQKSKTPSGVRPSDGAEITALSTHPKFATSIVPPEARTFRARFELLSAAAKDKRLSRADLGAFAVVLGRVNGKNGRSFPSLATIAKEAGTGLRSAPRSIAKLVALGYVIRSRGSSGRSTAYTWNWNFPCANADSVEKGTSANTVTDVAPHEVVPTSAPEQRDNSNQKKFTDTRARRMSISWIPSRETVEAMGREHPAVDQVAMLPDFRDFWLSQPGARGVSSDWDAQYRRRVRQLDRATPVALPARHYLSVEETKRQAEGRRRRGDNDEAQRAEKVAMHVLENFLAREKCVG